MLKRVWVSLAVVPMLISVAGCGSEQTSSAGVESETTIDTEATTDTGAATSPTTALSSSPSPREEDCLRGEGYGPFPSGPQTEREMNARFRCAMVEGYTSGIDEVLIVEYCAQLRAEIDARITAGGRMQMTDTTELAECDRGDEPVGFQYWKEKGRGNL